MKLADRLKRATGDAIAAPVSASAPAPEEKTLKAGGDESFDLKSQVHRALIERLDLSKLASVEREKLEGEFRQEVGNLLRELKSGMSRGEEDRLIAEVLNEIFGLGPIEPLLHDPTIEEIMVNGPKQVFCARSGKTFLTDLIFQDDAHLLHIIERIVSVVGRRIDESSPMVDARLLDGSRVNAIIPPLALDGPCLTIRKFPSERLKPENLLAFETLTAPMLQLLQGCVQARLNTLVSGRHSLRENDSPERALELYSIQRADHHHRGLRGAPASTKPHHPPGDPSSEPRRPGGDHTAGPGPEQPADAPRPHRDGRGPGRGGPGHAPGDEYGA